MLEPAMKVRLLTIILVLISLPAWVGVAEARLLLGVATDAGAGLTEVQAQQVTRRLAAGLGDEIELKKLPDLAALRNGLGHAAMLDLALIGKRRIGDQTGDYLVLGTIDSAGEVQLVARNGVSSDVLQRLTAVVQGRPLIFLSDSTPDTETGGVPLEDVVTVPAAITPDADQSSVEKTEESLDKEDEELSLLMPDQQSVPGVIAQPDLPLALRPPGVPVPSPGRLPRPPQSEQDKQLIASLPEPRKATPPKPPMELLPRPAADPRVVYVVPFDSVMVPREVESRLFDQFIEKLNAESDAIDLEFVILKEGLDRVDPDWLFARKYVTGEIYAYVEESGCCSTDLRAKVRIVYHKPYQQAPAFSYQYPTKRFFDHDQSSLTLERTKLADSVSNALAQELIKALKP